MNDLDSVDLIDQKGLRVRLTVQLGEDKRGSCKGKVRADVSGLEWLPPYQDLKVKGSANVRLCRMVALQGNQRWLSGVILGVSSEGRAV